MPPRNQPSSSKSTLPIPFDLFVSHVEQWKECTLCELHKTRKQVVHLRGDVPCQVLFVGEAPGDVEDNEGFPFIGPAGDKLQSIIDEAFLFADPNTGETSPIVTYALTNLIGCIPRDESKCYLPSEPGIEHIQACQPKLEELVKICDPVVIVCVGSNARDWIDPKAVWKPKLHKPTQHMEILVDVTTSQSTRLTSQDVIALAEIIHPSAILRMNEAQQGLFYRRSVVKLQDVAEFVLMQ